MQEIFSKFKIRLLPETIQRIQMDDATYFGPDYKKYVSNSKLALLNPAQGGSPQKFFEGFKSSNSQSLALGSATHQLTLEKNDYILSDIVTPSGKLGKMYDKFVESLKKENLMDSLINKLNNDNTEGFDGFIEIIESTPEIEKCLVLACIDSEYYVNDINNYNGNGLPSRIKTGLSKIFQHLIAEKPEFIDNKKVIYLPSDLLERCKKCTDSLNANEEIQKALNWPLSYCEDVILAELEIQFPKNFNDEFSEMITTIVPIKIKIDNWTIDHESKHFVLNDLKTTGKPIQYFMGHFEKEIGFMGEEKETFKDGSWQVFHYHRQMGMYLWLLREYIKKEYGEGYSCTANMLVVETIGAHGSKSYSVSNNDIVAGFKEFSDLIKRAAYHQVKGYENILEFEVNQLSDINLNI